MTKKLYPLTRALCGQTAVPAGGFGYLGSINAYAEVVCQAAASRGDGAVGAQGGVGLSEGRFAELVLQEKPLGFGFLAPEVIVLHVEGSHAAGDDGGGRLQVVFLLPLHLVLQLAEG